MLIRVSRVSQLPQLLESTSSASDNAPNPFILRLPVKLYSSTSTDFQLFVNTRRITFACVRRTVAHHSEHIGRNTSAIASKRAYTHRISPSPTPMITTVDDERVVMFLEQSAPTARFGSVSLCFRLHIGSAIAQTHTHSHTQIMPACM